MGFKSGFIGIVGRPNVGKSSLLNQLLGEKVSIVSNKAQTTRHNVRGILTVPKKYQLIFIDTPGIHTSTQELNRQMNAAVFKGIKAADLLVFLAPANEKIGKNDLYLLKEILKKQIPFIIGLSKKDLLPKEELDAKIQEWINLTESKTPVLPISIYDQASLKNLIKHLLKTLPPNDYQYFSNDEITDQPLKHQIQDLIREAILFKTGQEVPHSTLVIVETLENHNQVLKIQAAIIVERNSQKGILIGPRGKKIKDIKYRVRKELKKKYPEHEIDLTIMIKVKSNWRNSPSLLKKAMIDRGSLSD